MDSSSTFILFESDSDISTQTDKSMNIIDITQRVKRIYRLKNRILLRTKWKKFAIKIRLKAIKRIANKLFKLNFGYDILSNRNKSKYFNRWKRRTLFLFMFHKIIFRYRIDNIQSSLNNLQFEYSQNYQGKWQYLAQMLIKNSRKMQMAEIFNHRNLIKRYFYDWNDQFQFRKDTVIELKNKWTSFAHDLIYQDTIYNAYRLKWQFISQKLVYKSMKEFYQNEIIRYKWCQILRQYYFYNERQKFSLIRNHMNLRKRWIQMSQKYKIKCLTDSSYKAKLPSLFFKYIKMQKENKLHEMNRKLLATKELFESKSICKKFFLDWYENVKILKKARIITQKSLNYSYSAYEIKIKNDSARTIQKLC